MSLQNVNGSSLHHSPLSYADIRVVRHQATDFANSTFMPRSIESQFEGRWFPDEPSNELPQIDTKFGARRSVDQGEFSPSRKSRESRRGRELERTTFESQPRYASPEATFDCDGWCEHSDVQYANIVSIGRAPRGDVVTSCSPADISFGVLGPATRMGRPKRLANHRLVQLPELVYIVECHCLFI
jgi:hypothetical protein